MASPDESDTPLEEIKHLEMLEAYIREKKASLGLSDDPLSEVLDSEQKPPTV